jgi:hypothetical protein
MGFALNCEENYLGGIEIGVFWGLWAWFHVEVGRRGGSLCFFCVLEEHFWSIGGIFVSRS